VTCLDLSLDGVTLISGCEDELIHIWYIPSKQLLKTLTFKGPINNIKLRLTNPAIFQPENKHKQFFFNNFKRMVDSTEDDENATVEVLITDSRLSNGEQYSLYRRKEFNQNGSSIKKCTVERNVQNLQNEIQRLRQINNELFETSAKNLLRRYKQK